MRKLDINEKQKASYAIPLWLRDEQIRVNTAEVKGRLECAYELRSDPIAIVCYGPSLNNTWEKVRDFKYIMTCSGAHRFLIDRGIVPTWHAEVDPRKHKIQLLGEPHPDIEYLPASACHPDYFKHLSGFKVRLWHVYDPNEGPLRLLPRGEWALCGGCSVGLRAMVLARFIGFTEQYVFGMDGNSGPTGKHAAFHPMQAKESFEVEHEGVTYHTTPAFLEAARLTPYELDQLPDVKATFYGEGLVQALMKNYQRKVTPKEGSFIAFNKPELISPEMQRLNAQLHRDRLEYGVGGGRHADTVIKLRASTKADSVLDYGAGKGFLAKALPFPIWEYDPAVSGKQETPRPADLCVCSDVLEHIEPDKLMCVLDDLRRCVKMVGYFVINTGPAIKCYADGRNTHLIQKGRAWWEERLGKFFTIGKILESGNELHVVVGPKIVQHKLKAG